MVRAHAPGRAELRPGRRHMSNGACAPRSASARNEIERSRVGPVQVLEGEHDWLRPRPRQNPGSHRRQLPSPQLFGREFRGTVLAATGCQRAARAEAHIRLGRGRSDATCLRGRRDAVRRTAPRQIAAGPIRRSDAAACSATAARRPFDPGVRRLREPRMELLDEPRLAEAGLADDQHELALAFASAFPAPR